MLPVANVVHQQYSMETIYSILVVARTCQFFQPYIFIYTVWSMFFLLRYRLLYHVCILPCAGQLCLWCYMGMTISVSNICYYSIHCTMRLFQSECAQGDISSIIFSIYQSTYFHSLYVCESILWGTTHTNSKGWVLPCNCIEYYIIAYNTS